MIQTVRDRQPQAKRQRHPSCSYTQCYLPIADQQSQIDLQPDEKQEEDQANVGGRGEGRHGRRREDGIGKAWDAAKDGRAQQDPTDDFGNHTGLTEFLEGEMQQAAEDDDDTSLINFFVRSCWERRNNIGGEGCCY